MHRNMIEPTRVDSLIGELRDVNLVDAPGLPTDYGDIYPLGKPEPRRMTLGAIGWGMVGVVALVAVLLIYGAILAFKR